MSIMIFLIPRPTRKKIWKQDRETLSNEARLLPGQQVTTNSPLLPGQRVTTNYVRCDHRALDKSLEDELKILTNPRQQLDLLALSR